MSYITDIEIAEVHQNLIVTIVYSLLVYWRNSTFRYNGL